MRSPVVPEAEDTFWVWLGAPRPLAFSELEQALGGIADSLAIAAGEPREGVVGWRLSHLEAEAAAPIAGSKVPGSSATPTSRCWPARYATKKPANR